MTVEGLTWRLTSLELGFGQLQDAIDDHEPAGGAEALQTAHDLAVARIDAVLVDLATWILAALTTAIRVRPSERPLRAARGNVAALVERAARQQRNSSGRGRVARRSAAQQHAPMAQKA